jgi:predicted O-methyltransferase YrrM
MPTQIDKIQTIKHAMGFEYGGQSYNELESLYDICAGKDVLELGSMVGMSSYVIASVANSLVCVDIWSDTQEHLAHDPAQANIYASLNPKLPNMLKEFKKNCKEFLKTKKIKMYRGNTLAMAKKFYDEQFDIIFIDADHSYQGVSNDFELYRRKVKKDGYIIFHDYGDSMWTGIKRFCDESVSAGKIKLIKQVGRIAVFTL